MALQSGFNLPASDMAQILEKNDKTAQGIRTWRSLFGNASLANASAMDKITTSYSDAIAQAYRANLEQENQIMGAGLSSGATKSLLALSRDELQQTYDNYLANYSSALGDVASAYNEEVATIAGALDDRAQNLSDLYNSAYDYLVNELYPSTYTDKEGNVSNYLDNYGFNWLYNIDDAGMKTLKSWNEVARQIFDEEDNINVYGQNLFNALFNSRPEGYQLTDDDGNIYSTRTFDQWLSDTNPELREWFASSDPFNYTFAGTNKGTAQSLLGLDSTQANALGGIVNQIETTIQEYENTFSPEIDRMLNEYKDNYAFKYRQTLGKSAKAYDKKVNEMRSLWKNDAKNYRDYVNQLLSERIQNISNIATEYNVTSLKSYERLKEKLDEFAKRDYSGTDLFVNDYGFTGGRDDYTESFRKKLDEDDILSKDVDELRNLYNEFLKEVTSTIKDTGILPSSGF